MEAVLLIQSCPWKRIGDLIPLINERFPNSSLWLLTADPTQTPPGIFKKILSYSRNTKRFAPIRNRKFIEEISQLQRFHAVVFFYSDGAGVDYSNIRLLASKIDTSEAYAINRYNKWIALDSEMEIWDYILEFEQTYPKVFYRSLEKSIRKLRSQVTTLPSVDKPRRISIITNSMVAGGIELLLYKKIKAFVAKGYDIQLLSGSGGSLYSSFGQLPIEINVYEEQDYDVFSIHLLPWLVDNLANFQPDVLMVYHNLPFMPSLLAGAVCKIPLILRSENSIVTPGFMGRQNYERIIALGDCYNNTFSVSSATKRSLNKSVQEKSAVIFGTTVEQVEYESIPPLEIDHSTKIKFITVARLSKEKGIDYLLTAIAKVTVNYKNIEFYIVGEGDLRDSLEQSARALDIIEHVKFWGHREDIVACLSQSHVFVLPSIHEGLGMSIIEAMMAGRCVIASNVGGIPELLDSESGLLVEPANADSLAKALQEMIENPNLANKLGRKAKIIAHNKFTFDLMFDQLVRFIDLEWDKLPIQGERENKNEQQQSN